MSAAEKNICRPALNLIAEKEIEHDIAVVNAPDRAVGVDLHTQACRAFKLVGEIGIRPFTSMHTLPRGFFYDC